MIDLASNSSGATIVIPDLQRPYVWDPTQVTLLIDSLIRGWPFGTLLMWKVDQSQLGRIPHREFWQVVDRTSTSAGASVRRRDPPASYHMVLDGQQRVQSLLLALCGDGWGFKQEDRTWLEQIEGIRARGRKPTYPHWSKATLCFDVPAFAEEISQGHEVTNIDYRNILKWVVTDPAGGVSTWSKPPNYREPLPKSFDPINLGHYVGLGRLWEAVQPSPRITERQFREAAKQLLENHSVPSELVSAVLERMGELMVIVRDVKLSKITFLELRPFDSVLWQEDDYNEAIVNIFTRLNTAGRTLTREEITFAWLKMGWDDAQTEGKSAGQCFEQLLKIPLENELPIGMDDIVRAVSFIWSSSFRDGVLLSDKDLLKSDTVMPMSKDLSTYWKEIVVSLEYTLEAIKERGLKFGQNAQFSSFNSLVVIWAINFQQLRWLKSHPQRTTDQDSFEKSIIQSVRDSLDRWMIGSQWAGRWTSNVPMVGIAKALSSDQLKLNASSNIIEALAIGSNRLKAIVEEIVNDACTYIQQMQVDRREHVSRYNTMLWVWHRLESNRWEKSQIQLRTGVTNNSYLAKISNLHCTTLSLFSSYFSWYFAKAK